MEKISKTKLKEVNKLFQAKEQLKQQAFLVFDLASINQAKKLGLLKGAYQVNHGVVGIVHFPKSKPLSNHVVYLDEITDPGNLGKIIYLMKKNKIRDLILSKNSVSPFNKKCLMIAKDAIFDINIIHGDISLLKTLKKDYQIVATGLKGACSLIDLKLKDKYIIVFGNEARGVKKEILNFANEVVKIEIKNIDSLNVAVAASIIFNNLK
ncbi:MAG: RNA methyltransferase [Bacilli bacterium]|nr:RNA methyltransferase [Bacilli bacterium]